MCSKKRFFLFVVCIMMSVSVFSQSRYQDKLFYSDSDEYWDLKLLYANAGIVPPSTVFPITAKEMISLLDNIDENNLSQEFQTIYYSLYSALDSTQENSPSLGAGAALSIESYMQSNPQEFGGIAFDSRDAVDSMYPDTTVDSEYGHRLTHDENLLYGYSDRRPFLDVPLAFSFNPWVFGEFNVRVQNSRSFYAYDYAPSYNGWLSSNIFVNDQFFDINFPDEAYIAVDGPFFNVLIGRTGSGWGVGNSGNLLFGDHLDYYDNARVRFFNDVFSYTFQLTAFDTFFGHTPSTVVPGGPNAGADVFADEMRYFVGHRFEGRILDKVTLALSEGAMVQSETFLLQSLSPVAFLHNQYNYGVMNVSLAVDAEVYIWNGLSAHFQWISDQMSAPQEIEHMGDQIEPQAWGYLVGLSYENMFTVKNTPVRYSSFLEFVLTDPYLYLEQGEPNQYAYYRSFDVGFSNQTMGNGANTASSCRKIAKPIGYVYGPDAIVLTFGNSIQFDKLLIAPYFTYFLAGENNRALNYNIGHDANAETTPTGDVFEHNIILETSVSYKPFDFLEAYTHIGGIYSINHMNNAGNNAFDFQFTLGCTVHYDATLVF